MYYKFEIYPENKNNESAEELPYYIEFLQFFEKDPLRYSIYKRQNIIPDSEYKKDPNLAFISNEGHPYQLKEGIVNNNENCISFDTAGFLKHICDALNFYHKSKYNTEK